MNNKTKTSIKIVSVLLSFIMIFNNIASVAVLGIIKKAKINLKETYSVVNEEENSIQIACVGNSNLYSGFSPLNYSGAKAITNYIGYYIKNSYSIENLKGNQKYTYWNDNYQNFMAYKSKLEE